MEVSPARAGIDPPKTICLTSKVMFLRTDGDRPY